MAVLKSESKRGEEKSLMRDILLSSAGRYADCVALRQKEDGIYADYTYRRLRSDVEALGIALSSVVSGSRRVMIVGDNCYAWAISYLACLCGAGIAMPVDKDFSAQELEKLAKFGEVCAVLYSDSVSEKLVGIDAKKIAFSAFDEFLGEGRAKIEGGEKDFWSKPIDKDAEAALFFTSASTDTPKGVLLSNVNLCYTLAGTASLIQINEQDKFLSTLPLHHIFECTCTLLGAIYAGASVAFGEGLRRIIRNMNETKPTILVAVPMILEALAKWISADGSVKTDGLTSLVGLLPGEMALAARRRLFSALHKKLGGCLRMVVTGSMPIDPDVLAVIRSVGIATVEGYGLTECAPVVTVNPVSRAKAGSVGVPFADSTLDIYNIQEDGRGEIRYKGRNAMLGYFKNPDLTAETLRGGWLYTGDLGYLDKEGYLFLVGRKKNAMVMANGKHVYPEEIEVLLCKSRFVKEAIVVGYYNEAKGDNDLVAVLHPDYTMIKSVYGDIYTRSDVEAELRAAMDAANELLPAHKKLDLFLVKKEEFNKHRSRKIRRTGVAELVYDDYLKHKK